MESGAAAARSPRAQALDLFAWNVAVGDERAVAGHTDLAAVRVAGEDRIRAQIDEAAEHPLVWRVRERDGEVPVLAL
ncbi:hypothetical protein ACFPRL_12240 [Pseudoclavibacter helvolus]